MPQDYMFDYIKNVFTLNIMNSAYGYLKYYNDKIIIYNDIWVENKVEIVSDIIEFFEKLSSKKFMGMICCEFVAKYTCRGTFIMGFEKKITLDGTMEYKPWLCEKSIYDLGVSELLATTKSELAENILKSIQTIFSNEYCITFDISKNKQFESVLFLQRLSENSMFYIKYRYYPKNLLKCAGIFKPSIFKKWKTICSIKNFMDI